MRYSYIGPPDRSGLKDEIAFFENNLFKFYKNEAFIFRKKLFLYSLDYFILDEKGKYIFNIPKLNNVPDERKYKKLIHEVSITLKGAVRFYNLINFSTELIKFGHNKEKVFNNLQEEVNSKEVVLYPKYSKEFIKLISNYPTDRVFSLIRENGTDTDLIKDIVEYYKIVDDKELPKKPKKLMEIHDFLQMKFEMSEIEDYSLNTREDFLKLDKKEFNILGKRHKIIVPKTRKDLCTFSTLFNNCVGRLEDYAERCVLGRSHIVGVFDEFNKPLYCIETEAYSFKEAKGVSNTVIPKNIYRSLQDIITRRPEIPADFIPIKNHFIGGYKYDPENKKLYVVFSKSFMAYEYLNVEEATYQKFMYEEYKGRFLNSHLKNYPCNRLGSIK